MTKKQPIELTLKNKNDRHLKQLAKVKNTILSRGEVLLSEYVSANLKLKIQCKEKHVYEIRWLDISQGKGCSYCTRNKKLTIEQVKEEVVKRGQELLSQEYINSSTHLLIKCKAGHEFKITWANYSRTTASGCKICSDKNSGSSQRLTLDFIKSQIENRKEKLISNSYINDRTKLDVQCERGHLYKISWNNFKRERGCPTCACGGFDPNKPALFYYIRFKYIDKFFYKIGITNQSVKNRFKECKAPFVVIYEQHYEQGKNAYEREQKLLKRFSSSRLSIQYFSAIDFLKQCGGHTECFKFDVLGLDKDNLS